MDVVFASKIDRFHACFMPFYFCFTIFDLLTTCLNPPMIFVTVHVSIWPINAHSFFTIFHSNSHSLVLFLTFFRGRVSLSCTRSIETFIVVVQWLESMVKVGCPSKTCISDRFEYGIVNASYQFPYSPALSSYVPNFSSGRCNNPQI